MFPRARGKKKYDQLLAIMALTGQAYAAQTGRVAWRVEVRKWMTV